MNMGQAASRAANWAEAEPYLQEAYVLARSEPGVSLLTQAQSANDLGVLYNRMRRKTDALRLMTEACDCLQRRGVADHEYAKALDGLAQAHAANGDLESAEAQVRRSIEVKKSVFGDSHPAVARGLHNLGSMLIEKKQYRDALNVLEAAWRIVSDEPTAKDELVRVLGLRATAYNSVGEYPAALRCSLEAMTLLRDSRRSRSKEYSAQLVLAATSHWCAGDTVKAEAALREAYDIDVSIEGPEGPGSRRDRSMLVELSIVKFASEVYSDSSPQVGSHVGRNEPCPCGSGKKYKRCCGA